MGDDHLERFRVFSAASPMSPNARSSSENPQTLNTASEFTVAVATMLLAVRRFGLVATDAIVRTVGDRYNDNIVLATLHLLDGGPGRPRDLSVALDIPTPSISRVIDALEASGDVVRQGDRVAEDERAVLLALTRQGRRRGRAAAAAVLATAPDSAPALLEAIRLLDLTMSPDTETAPPDTSPSGLCLALGRMGIGLGKVLREPLDDSSGALALCSLVVEGGESRPTRIASHVGLTSGGTTKTLDRLESAGFIERTFGTASDRRAVKVTLTASGQQQVDLMVELMKPHLSALRRSFVAVCDQLELAAS